jgi:hypothetical protein
MAFEWDAAKAASNLRKHGVDFADAVGVFHDPYALSRPDDAPDEERFVGIGSDFLGRILVVVYTYRGADIRIISARTATRSERSTYEAGLS